jgi:hypothetical protein
MSQRFRLSAGAAVVTAAFILGLIGSASLASAATAPAWKTAVAFHSVLARELRGMCGTPVMKALSRGRSALHCAGGYPAVAQRNLNGFASQRLNDFRDVPDRYRLVGYGAVDPSVQTPAVQVGWSAGFDFDTAGTVPSSLAAISCPVAAQCTAVDAFGVEVTFYPPHAGQPAPHRIDRNVALTSVSCPSIIQCTAVDPLGNEITFDPNRPSPAPRFAVDPDGAGLWGIACETTSRCDAVDGLGNVVAFDPQRPGQAAVVSVDPGGGGLVAVACPGATMCVAVDSSGNSVTFDPGAPQRSQPVARDRGRVPNALACPGVHECAAVDEAGAEVTFDPTAATGPAPAEIDPAGTGLTSVACSETWRCTAVDLHDRELTFDPTRPGSPAAHTVDLNGNGIAGVSCPSWSACIAVDLAGDEVTFTPLAPGGRYAVALTQFPQGVDDPASDAHDQYSAQFGGSNTTGVTCESATQCTAVDADGYAVTANPESPGIVARVLLDRKGGLYGIGCPSAQQCTAAGGNYEITFNPQHPGHPRLVQVDRRGAGSGIRGLACPLRTLCAGVDRSGEVSFDPRSPLRRSYRALMAGDVAAIACPAATECVALRSHGLEVAFNPLTGRIHSRFAFDRHGDTYAAITCPTGGQCTAVGYGDTRPVTELAATFDPRSPAHVERGAILTGLGADAIDCASTVICKLGDVEGDIAAFNPLTLGHRQAALDVQGNEITEISYGPGFCLAVDGSGTAFVGQIA